MTVGQTSNSLPNKSHLVMREAEISKLYIIILLWCNCVLEVSTIHPFNKTRASLDSKTHESVGWKKIRHVAKPHLFFPSQESCLSMHGLLDDRNDLKTGTTCKRTHHLMPRTFIPMLFFNSYANFLWFSWVSKCPEHNHWRSKSS